MVECSGNLKYSQEKDLDFQHQHGTSKRFLARGISFLQHYEMPVPNVYPNYRV
jgi:hypothetical protein